VELALFSEAAGLWRRQLVNRPPSRPGGRTQGTFIPSIQFTAEFLAILVAVIVTTLSAYLYTWQSNVEVEEEIPKGRTRLEERQGASDEELP
jgi:hypothetical protein